MANETTNAIRKALKSAGYNRNDVRVRLMYSNVDESIQVTITRADIAMAEIDALIAPFRSESPDKGGNMWITVAYDKRAVAPYVARANAYLEGIDDRLVTVGPGLRAKVERHMVSVYRDGETQPVIYCHGIGFAAEQLATLLMG